MRCNTAILRLPLPALRQQLFELPQKVSAFYSSCFNLSHSFRNCFSATFLLRFEPSAMDSYFEKQDKPTVFLVLGKEVIVDDERLATALSRLPELRR